MPTTNSHPMTTRRVCVCILSITALTIFLSILLFVILGFTVFKAKHPITTVNSISVADLNLSIDAAKLEVHLNTTLDVDATVKNPNRVGFKYTDSTALLQYRGIDVGEVFIPAGEIGARATRGLNLTLAVMTDRLLSEADFYGDVISGTVAFRILIRVSGTVHILLANIRVVEYSTCDLEIHIRSKSLFNQTCQYRTKL